MSFGVMALLKEAIQLNTSEIVSTSLEFSRAFPQKYPKMAFVKKANLDMLLIVMEAML